MTERKKPRSPLHHKPEAVTEARERLGLTKAEVAARAEVVPSLITEIEKGSRNATPAMILVLAGILQCDPDTLRRRPLGAPQDVAA
jgi:transcriptional regulator with XRE-family HTH domain